jgi:phosphoadenosine phosphosulfate reductase
LNNNKQERLIAWCDNCRIPVIGLQYCACGTRTCEIASDLRPVFPEERYLLYKLTDNDSFVSGPVWAAQGNRYYLGKEVISLSSASFENADARELAEYVCGLDLTATYETFNREMTAFTATNKQHLYELDYAAITFVQDVVHNNPHRIPVVSFSGGKDSTVVSDLVRRAMSTPSILHLFADTTLEMPQTYEYLERFRKSNPYTPFIISKSDHDFMELCASMGPPSRVMSWCCTIFKTGPLNNVINGFAKNKQLMTFYGIRGSESISRSNYQDIQYNQFDKVKTTVVSRSPKIAKQNVTSPIFEWLDIDIWLYLLSNAVDFNDAYRLGYSRVGCWCCPNNSKWSMFLSSIFLPEASQKWTDFLIDFAKHIGKPDPEEYVRTGKWKARQGGAGLDSKQIVIEAKPCVDEEFARTFTLSKPINKQLYEYFKPFGKLSWDLGKKMLNEVYILDRKTNKPIIKLSGNLGSYNLRVVCINPRNYKLISQRIDCQIRKYQSCIGCQGCISKCPTGSISYVDNYYAIREETCTGCLECVNPWRRGGCLMSKVLSVKKGV